LLRILLLHDDDDDASSFTSSSEEEENEEKKKRETLGVVEFLSNVGKLLETREGIDKTLKTLKYSSVLTALVLVGNENDEDGQQQTNREAVEKTCEKFEHKPRVVATGEVFKVFFAVSRTFGAVFSRSRRRKEQKKFEESRADV